MKQTLISLALILVVSSAVSASGNSVRPVETYDNFNDFVKDVKKAIAIERSYKIETEESFDLKPGQAARFDFIDNPAGVVEFIFFYDNASSEVHVIYRFTDDAADEYDGTTLSQKRLKDYRVVNAPGAEKYLEVFSSLTPDDGKAILNFRAALITKKEFLMKNKEPLAAAKRRQQANLEAISELQWDHQEAVEPLDIILDESNSPSMAKLRNKYDLEELVSEADDDYQKLKLITAWVNKQWEHNGNNTPSKSDPLTILEEAAEGKRFRCVEYATVVAAVATSLGMPSRTIGLKRADVETAESGAGHAVAEVWLSQFNKWVFVDGQWGVIPDLNGVPLSAVEFQSAIANELQNLKIWSSTKEDNKIGYLTWVAPYLYYFDSSLDERFYRVETEKERLSLKGNIMLVPKGATKPKVFQRKSPMKNMRYTSNPTAFYPQMDN